MADELVFHAGVFEIAVGDAWRGVAVPVDTPVLRMSEVV
jgi:hypothetical protein